MKLRTVAASVIIVLLLATTLTVTLPKSIEAWNETTSELGEH